MEVFRWGEGLKIIGENKQNWGKPQSICRLQRIKILLGNLCKGAGDENIYNFIIL